MHCRHKSRAAIIKLKMQNLAKYVHMVTINNNIPTQLNVMENTVIYGTYRIASNYGWSRINARS